MENYIGPFVELSLTCRPSSEGSYSASSCSSCIRFVDDYQCNACLFSSDIELSTPIICHKIRSTVVDSVVSRRRFVIKFDRPFCFVAVVVVSMAAAASCPPPVGVAVAVGGDCGDTARTSVVDMLLGCSVKDGNCV
jgi:hypothetical protein